MAANQAAEIVAVDVTPEALLNRLKCGVVYKPEMVEKALAKFFTGSNLGALCELTLRQAAQEVELRQFAFDQTSGFQVPRVSEARNGQARAEPTKERILIHITAEPSTAMLIRRGRRVTDYLQADCLALFVHNTPRLVDLPATEREAVEKHLRFARSVRIETQILCCTDIPKTVVDFARRNQVTHIFVARMRKHFHERLLGKDYPEAIVRDAHDLQVTVVADRSRIRIQALQESADQGSDVLLCKKRKFGAREEIRTPNPCLQSTELASNNSTGNFDY